MLVVGLLLFGLGARLLWKTLARGGGPELGIAVLFLCGGLGGPMLFAGAVPGGAGDAQTPWLIGAGQSILTVGFCGLYVFVWRTFGMASAWRRVLCAVGCVAGVASCTAIGVVEGFAPVPGPTTVALLGSRLLAVSWAFGETARYAVLMRRRQRLGLADAVVANRFLLWAIWTGAFLAVVLLGAGVRGIQFQVQAGAVVDTDLVVTALRSGVIVGMTAASTAMGLSFFPPQRYADWLRGGSGASA